MGIFFVFPLVIRSSSQMHLVEVQPLKAEPDPERKVWSHLSRH